MQQSLHLTDTSKIKKIVEKNRIDSTDVKSLFELCLDSGAFEYVRQIAAENKALAVGKLDLLKPSNARNVLLSLVDKSFDRLDRLCV